MSSRPRRRHRSLKAYRRANRLSQAAAAQLFNITQAQWCRLETGRRRPRIPLAQTLAQRTGVPLSTLLGLREQPIR